MIQNKTKLHISKLLKVIVFVLLLLSGFLTPIIKEYYSNNWKNEVELIKKDIHQKVKISIEDKYKILKSYVDRLKSFGENTDANFYKTFTDSEILAGLYDENYRLLNWTKSLDKVDINKVILQHRGGEYFIYDSPLIEYLSMYERIGNRVLFLSLPLKKKYNLNKKYFKEIDFFSEIEKSEWTEIEILTQDLQLKDGRQSSFPLYNNLKNLIATVVFKTPTLDSFIGKIFNNVFLFQSILLILLLWLWGLSLKKYLNHFNNKFFSEIIFIIYLILFRYILLYIGFPSNFMNNSISNPISFSSTFAFGIVKSPIELLLTIFFASLILKIFTNNIIENDILRQKSASLNIWKRLFLIGLLIVLVICYLLLWRTFGASIKSIVFDSSLRYFNEYDFIPEMATLIMELNVLLIGVVIMWAALIVLYIIHTLFVKVFNFNNQNLLLIDFILFQFLGLIFDLFQNQPQGNHLIRFVFISSTIIFLGKILNERKLKLLPIIYFLLLSSFISIVMLINHSSNLEIKSLKTIANEVTRSNESFLKFSIFKCLSEANDNYELKYMIRNHYGDLNQAAFVIWSKSDFANMSVISNVNIISSDKKLLGSFAFEYSEDFFWDWSKPDEDLKGQRIITINSDEETKIIRGIIPLKIKNEIIGYLEVSTIIDLNSLGIENLPPIFNFSNLFYNTPIDVKQLRIFDFQNGTLKNYYTDIILPNNAIKSILKTKLSASNKAWIDLLIDDKLHTFYIQEIRHNNITRRIAIGKAEKNAVRYLFDFFKIFFVHTMFIIFFVIIFYIVWFNKETKPRYSFRFQLLIAFTVISLLPLIFLAFYFRNITNEKNLNSIYYKLGKRADSVENYFQKKNSVDLVELLQTTSKDIDINFSLYENKDLIYSTKADYYNAGLIPKIINPIIFNSLVLGEQKEFVLEENIDNYTYHSLYHKTNLNGKIYIIKISDLFNSIQLPMTGNEIDVFFFGIYSFTIIMLLFMSVFLANQISYPIRKLTQSMNSVGAGDFNIELNLAGRGEIKDLINGFNKMVKHLKKNQNELAERERETAWKEMAKQVAHEIKNPLTPMKLSIQQLITAKNDNSPKFDEYFFKITDTIIKQIDNLKNIASEFSNFARMPNIKIKNYEIISLLKQTFNIFNDEKTEINLITDLKQISVNIDLEQFQRMIINLIRNSIQANAMKIDVYVECDNENLIIRICDNGSGIPENISDKIFELNFTTKSDGMGLGLYLTKRFVESMKGSIQLIKFKNFSTCFEIKFPLADEQAN